MSFLTKIRRAIATKALSVGEMVWPGQSMVWFDLDRPTVDRMEAEIGDGTGADVLMTPIRWLQRAIVEAPFVALDEDGNPLDTSPVVDLLADPGPWFTSEVLLAGTVLSLVMDGNAYWLMGTDGNGDVRELNYIPHHVIEPKWPDDGKTFISHYEYSPSGRTMDLAPEDVIHFRDGVDPDNLRKGLSPAKGLLREVWTDQEAALFVGAMLKNNGIPGVVLSPKDKDWHITKEEAEAAEAKIETKYTRSGRGRPIVMSGPVDIQEFGYSPQQLDLSPLRDISEERVCAALGVPAAIVGFGAGMQQTKVGATMRELRQLAWWNAVIPLQRTIAAELNRSLAPLLDDDAEVSFDLQKVEALRENQDSLVSRQERLYRAGIVTRSEARSAVGLESGPTDDVYLVDVVGFGLIPQGQQGPESPELLRGAAGNGSGEAEERQRLIEGMKQGDHSQLELDVIERAPRRSTPQQIRAYLRHIDRIRRQSPLRFASALRDVFEELGERVAEVAGRVLESRGMETVSADEHDTKQDDDIPSGLVEAIMAELEILASERALQRAFEANFLSVAQEVSGALESSFGIEFTLPDPAQLNVLQQGGLRLGLIDLDSQTRDALFDALTEARAEGLSGPALARRIRHLISAGPWGDVATRALVIARTEGAHAANAASIEAARAMEGVEMMMVHDNRTGYNDDVCAGINGRVVTVQEADALGLAHPNCTRSFTPIPELLAREMGLP